MKKSIEETVGAILNDEKPKRGRSRGSKTRETKEQAIARIKGQNPFKSEIADELGLPQRDHVVPEFTGPADSPQGKLKRLVMLHHNNMKQRVTFMHWSRPKKSRVTGEIIPPRMSPDMARRIGGDLRFKSEGSEKAYNLLEIWSIEGRQIMSAATKIMNEIPIWRDFLKDAYLVGPVTAAYLLAHCDIRKAEKPSQLIRYCGLAVINGRLERRTLGVQGTYNDTIRPKLYTMGEGINKAKARKANKLTRLFMGYLYRLRTDPRYVVSGGVNCWIPEAANGVAQSVPMIRQALLGGARVLGADESATDGLRPVVMNSTIVGYVRLGGRMKTYKDALFKTVSVFLQDLYIVWRTFEGLPVWPTYYAAKQGYYHGGVPLFSQAPRIWTPDEVSKIIADYRAAPLTEAEKELAAWCVASSGNEAAESATDAMLDDSEAAE